MPTVQKFPCAGMTINQIVMAFEANYSVTVQNVSVEGEFASVYFITNGSNFEYAPEAIDEIPLIKQAMPKYNGFSSGEISLETGYNRGAIKEAMRQLDKAGEGEYSMFDGMYYFWYHNAGSEDKEPPAGNAVEGIPE